MGNTGVLLNFFDAKLRAGMGARWNRNASTGFSIDYFFVAAIM